MNKAMQKPGRPPLYRDNAPQSLMILKQYSSTQRIDNYDSNSGARNYESSHQ